MTDIMAELVAIARAGSAVAPFNMEAAMAEIEEARDAERFAAEKRRIAARIREVGLELMHFGETRYVSYEKFLALADELEGK